MKNTNISEDIIGVIVYSVHSAMVMKNFRFLVVTGKSTRLCALCNFALFWREVKCYFGMFVALNFHKRSNSLVFFLK